MTIYNFVIINTRVNILETKKNIEHQVQVLLDRIYVKRRKLWKFKIYLKICFDEV